MKNLIILLVLFFVEWTVSLTLEYSQLVDPFNAVQNPCDDIRNGQFICQDCGTLGFCVQQNGAWTTLKLSDCQTQHNLYCDEEARGCVFKKNCREITRGPKFECQNAGIFPDPYDCKYYHFCDKNNEGQRVICVSGTAYSPATKTCSIMPNTDICVEPQYECNAFGQMAAWPTDASIYYVCHVKNIGGKQLRYPVLYHCQSDYIFVNSKCIPYTSPNATPPPAPTAVSEIKTCQRGSDLAPNPYDCYSYFICVNERLVSTMCPTGTHFSSSTKSCIFGKC